MGLLDRLSRLLGLVTPPAPGALGGFVGHLLQTFEDCRPGLSDEVVARDPAAASRYFVELYERERPRLRDAIHLQERLLAAEDVAQLEREVDDLVRRVVLPAYQRLALRFTARERNDFYLLPEGLHGLESVLWAVAGLLVGLVGLRLPLPFWLKDSVLLLGLAGLFVPDLRRFRACRRYQAELAGIVTRADREIDRLDISYLTRRREGATAAPADEAAPEDPGAALPDASPRTPAREGR